VKTREFIKHLEKYNCVFYREGKKHSIYQNTITKKKTTIPRHNTIDRDLAVLI